MEKLGDIEIRVIGKSGNHNLSPENYDIRYIASILKDVEDLLFPNNKKDRPLIAYNITEGSVKHLFKTSIQTIIGFSALLNQIELNNSIDFLDVKTARAIENLQNLSFEKNYSFQIKTSLKEKFELEITPRTKFLRTENSWVDAEFYFYGVLTNAGGKNKSNIHLDTSDYGSLVINTGKDFLMEQELNLLYKKFGIRALGKQNVDTGEIDTKSLSLIELIDYSPKYDYDYLKSLIDKARRSWEDVDSEEWLNNLRGDYEV